MNRIPEIKAALADITTAPWVYFGHPETAAHLVLSEGAKNGKAPLVAMSAVEADARFIAKAPELLAWATEEIERLRRAGRRR